MRLAWLRIATLLPIVVFSVASRADDATQAREHFQKASAYFAVGDFKKAADEYQAAYLLKQDPALLYDAAQSLRLAGENEKALVLYRNCLRFFPNETNADEVRSQITKLEAAIAAQRRAKTSPPTTPANPSHLSTIPAAPRPMPAVATATQPTGGTTTAPARKRKWWIAGIVAGAVVAVGLGVGLGVGLSSGSPPSPTFGTVGVQ